MTMYNSGTLPPPNFNNGPRPLRLTPEISRSTPQGECHFQHPGIGAFRCQCQMYQHDRNLAGNVCDCGHSACYHAPTTNSHPSTDKVVAALVEKVKKLEETVMKERHVRERLISTERQAWEHEARMLREALIPFRRSEHDMRKNLIEIERRIETNTTETSRIRHKLSAVDNSSRSIERRLYDCERSACRKRKASIGRDGRTDRVMSPASTHTSSSSDMATNSRQRNSQSPSSPGQDILPESTGVLHLKPEENGLYSTTMIRLPLEDNEPRSSGFLSIDLAERLRHKTAAMKSGNSLEQQNLIPKSFSTGLPTPVTAKPSGFIAVSDLLSTDQVPSYMEGRIHKRMKYNDPAMTGASTGLELLANVASPLMQRG